jgi:signal transduction histidine kinase
MRIPLPRRSVRLRLTALYGILFLLSGAVLLAITSGVVVARSMVTAPVPGQGQGQQNPQSALGRAQARIQQLQAELAAHTAHGVAHQLLVGSAVALSIMTAASAVLGWIIAGRVLRPLQAMTAATRRISADSLHERLTMPGPRDELTDLGDTIDGLLGRLESAFAAQRRFAANASHELRTPLTTMRASVDVAVAKPGLVPGQTIALAGRLRAELDRVDELLDGLLALARAQHGVLPDRAVLSLGALASASLAARSGAITARKLTVQNTDSPGGAWVAGSQPLLRRMVDNVIDNAVGHNVGGGWISVATGADGALALLAVETGGEVLGQRQVDQLAQPFRRLGADRTGTAGGAGLGLSIVAAIAEAHGGTLDLRARAGGGLRVAIGLPLAAPAAAATTPRAGVAR